MSNSNPINDIKSKCINMIQIDEKVEKVNKLRNKKSESLLDNSKNVLNNENVTLSTNMSVGSFDYFKNYRKDRFGVTIRKHSKKHKVVFNDKIDIYEVDNYKEYNQTSPFNFFDSFSEINMSCSGCKII